MKNLINILLTLIIISCSSNGYDNQSDLILKLENEIQNNYKVFRSFYPESDSINAIKLYLAIEQFYIFSGVLESNTKTGYDRFYNLYIQNDSIIELSCLYRYHPKASVLISPVNLANNFYAFESVINEHKELLDESSSIIMVYQSLMNMRHELNLRFDKQSFNSYLDAISASDFENKTIYRLPLIAFTHVILSERMRN